jgi:hypothetical protein
MLMALYRENYRFRLLLATCATVAIGIISRVVYADLLIWDKYLGDAAYAALFYLVAGLIWKDGTIAAKAALVAIYVVAIELFQLTPIPLQLNQSDNFCIRIFARAVLGSVFCWWDLLAYSVGIVIATLVDRFLLRERRSSNNDG